MFCTAGSVSVPWGMLVSKVHQVLSIKCKVITTFRAPPLSYWSINIFQHNPQDQWFIYIILAQCKFYLAAETRPLLSHPFTNSHFHFLTIVKSVTSQMLLQQPKLHEAIFGRSGHLSQDIILLHNNAIPHSTNQSQQLFQLNFLDHPS
jgi:hypothetical protein